MSEHERSISAQVPAEDAFRFLSSVSNLPLFLPYLQELREDEEDHVFGTIEFDGQRREVSGSFRADPANRRLDWESDGTPAYRGWARIVPWGANDSRITVYLCIDSATPEASLTHPSLTGDGVEREFDGLLSRLGKLFDEEKTRRAA